MAAERNERWKAVRGDRHNREIEKGKENETERNR